MRYQVQENCLTIYLPREVDHHNADEIRKEADAVISRNHIRYVIFDFDRTDFMDSSGIGAVLGRYKKLSNRGGVLCVAEPNKNVNRIFELAGLYKIIKNKKR
jgi:stage II sporulation protein AA (anti-sigma F factor antagonist)